MRVYESTSDLAEAQWMVDEMRELLRPSAARPPEGARAPSGGSAAHAVASVGATVTERKEIAVLYRSTRKAG